MTDNVADEVLGRFARQQHDWFERVRKGSLDPEKVMRAVQEMIDGGTREHFCPADTITLPASKKRFNPDEYYQTCDGLYVWDDFSDRIIPATSPIRQVPEMEVRAFDLDKSMNDAEIRAKLPKGHVFEDASIFCAHLGGMIDRQPKGKEGDLLSNGYANIFYVRGKANEVFAVHVYWNAGHREWLVYTNPLADYSRDAGNRVFSATIDA